MLFRSPEVAFHQDNTDLITVDNNHVQAMINALYLCGNPRYCIGNNAISSLSLILYCFSHYKPKFIYLASIFVLFFALPQTHRPLLRHNPLILLDLRTLSDFVVILHLFPFSSLKIGHEGH